MKTIEHVIEFTTEDYARLWLCRMFDSSKSVGRLINQRGFHDDDVAWALGLGHLVERTDFCSNDFDPAEAQSALSETHMEMEMRRMQASGGALDRSVGILGDVLGLSQTERELLKFFAVKEAEPALGDGLRLFRGLHRKSYMHLLAQILGLPRCEVIASMSPDRPLIRSSLVCWRRNPRGGQFLEMRLNDLVDKMLDDDFSISSAIRAIVLPSPAPTLGYQDYPHIKETLDYLRTYLRDALNRRAIGVNIFIHGAPGTGKSELVRVLAREMRAELLEVSTENADGDPSGGSHRMGALRAAQALMASQRALLVFDEAEDIFRDQSFLKRSIAEEHKGWMNRFFETNPIPTFWLSNSGRGLDPAFVRRFDFAFELQTPPRGQRVRTYRKICRKGVSGRTIEQLAECEALTPAVVARAYSVASRIASARRSCSVEHALMHLAGHTLKAQGHSAEVLRQESVVVPNVYDLSFLNCDTPLESLVGQFSPQAGCRMCLYGPPGTGKTTFGHWLAKELGIPIHVRLASDIISPYVGETECNLARVFYQAKEDRALLLIDEVDSFLRDRRLAQRSWELSQVNEMLSQMQRFPGIFIASTNLVDELDQASLRRFDLKIGFGFMRPEQVAALLERQCRDLSLGRPSPGLLEQAAGLSNATPGDFANVARQHRFRTFNGPEAFLRAVEDECRMKEGGRRNKLGF